MTAAVAASPRCSPPPPPCRGRALPGRGPLPRREPWPTSRPTRSASPAGASPRPRPATTGPDGRTIARLVSAYAPGSFAPDYEFQDLRTGAREAVRSGPGRRAPPGRGPGQGPSAAPTTCRSSPARGSTATPGPTSTSWRGARSCGCRSPSRAGSTPSASSCSGERLDERPRPRPLRAHELLPPHPRPVARGGLRPRDPPPRPLRRRLQRRRRGRFPPAGGDCLFLRRARPRPDRISARPRPPGLRRQRRRRGLPLERAGRLPPHRHRPVGGALARPPRRPRWRARCRSSWGSSRWPAGRRGWGGRWARPGPGSAPRPWRRAPCSTPPVA